MLRWTGSRHWQLPATRTGPKWGSVSGPGPRWLGQEKLTCQLTKACAEPSSVGWGTAWVPLSHTEGESKESLAALGPRRLSEPQGRPLKEGDMTGKGEEQVAGLESHPGGGKALLARK